MQIGLARW